MKIRKKQRKMPKTFRQTWPYLISGHALSLMASGTVLASEPFLNPPNLANKSTSLVMAASELRQFQIPPGLLQSALTLFAEVSELELFYRSDLAKGRRTQGVQGRYTHDQALQLLLNGTGLGHRFSGDNMVTLFVEKADDASVSSAVGAVAATAAVSQAQEQDVPIVEVQPIEVTDTITRNKVFLPPVDGYKADETTGSTRTVLPINETPTSIGVVTRDIIRDTRSLRQSDAFEHVSGVSRGSTRRGRAEGFNIRGLNVGSFEGSFGGLKQNGLVVDGLFAPDPALIERYEIIKGPASIAGGASSPGGLVNRITKTPQYKNFATSEFQVGSFGLYRGVVDANGVLPQHQTIRGRLIFAVEEGGNFVDELDVRQYTVAPSLAFDLFDGAGTLLLTGHYQTFDGSNWNGLPLMADGKAPDISRTRNIGGGSANGAKLTFEGQNYEAHYNHEFVNGLTLSMKGKYAHSELSDKSIYPYTPGGIPANGDTAMTQSLRELDWETYAGEIFLSQEFDALGQKHEVLVGVDHRDQNHDFVAGYDFVGGGDFSGAIATDNIFNPRNSFQLPSDDVLIRQRVSTGGGFAPFNPRTIDIIQTGLFGQVVIRPIKPLTLVAAGRYDWAEVTTTGLNSTPHTIRAGDYSEFTGRVGATYEVIPDLRVYGGYAQSFQANLFSLTVDGSLVPPETGENYEVGAKWDLFEGRLRLTTALFRTYRQNVATSDIGNPGFSVAVGEQRHQGVEFDMNGQPWPGLNLTANVSYIDSEITKSNSAAQVGASPRRVPRSYVGRVFGTYELQSGPLQGVGFGGGVFFHGGFELETPNRFGTDPYQRVDAVVFYRPPQKAYDFTINVRNLLDARYIEIPGGVNAYNYFGAPVSVFGTLRVNFDSDLEWTPPWAD
ncbi:TonB-dependent siderophore receptor [Nitrospira sp. M1]